MAEDAPRFKLKAILHITVLLLLLLLIIIIFIAVLFLLFLIVLIVLLCGIICAFLLLLGFGFKLELPQDVTENFPRF
uniref:Uncharacterized protein n=1 Tax=Leersia perrieri TaxID=77586 RepID=A0A0D9XUQ3_9ORYZ